MTGSLSRTATRIGAALAIACLLALAAPQGAVARESTPTDTELRLRIEARLAALPELEGTEIRVVLREGQVVLQGSVLLLEQSLRAEQSVWKTAGVVDVENELKVISLEPRADATIEREIRTLLKGDGRFLDAQVQLQIREGIVLLRGRFEDPVDVLALKHGIAAIPGVRGVEIDAILVALQRPSRPPRP